MDSGGISRSFTQNKPVLNYGHERAGKTADKIKNVSCCYQEINTECNIQHEITKETDEVAKAIDI